MRQVVCVREPPCETIKDAELYDRLLNEFPRWLTKAREKRILTR
ncbi:MAG: VWA domain-containing protein [Candidatus Competibacteraceae bacterium]|nr:VWA domain-containing protein [Candidatus Competibacteraceae bacterium]